MDTVRGEMILLVVLYHATTRVTRYDPEALPWLSDFNNFWEPFRMPTLVLLSGMLLSRSLSKPRRDYILGKVRNLLWPYCVWSFIFITLLAATGAGQSQDSLTGQLLGIATGTATYLWFLSFLFAYYIISLFISKDVRLFLIPVLLAASAPLNYIDGYYQLYKFLFMLAFFWLGDAAMNSQFFDRAWVRSWWALSGAAIVAGVAGVSAVLLGTQVRYMALYCIPVAAGILVIIRAAQLIGDTKVARLLQSVGSETIVYYTSHYTIIAVAYYVLARALPVDQPLVLLFAGLLSALGGGFALVWLRHNLKAFDVLFVLPSYPRLSVLWLRPARRRAIDSALTRASKQ
ncbi:hypothetical protein BCM27_06355 [Gordonia terrae]|nr:hypothetical protein BCM27_06355 [Gordonia terrae]